MKALLGKLYIQVFVGIILGGLIGCFAPDFGTKLQPFADAFIKLIKMLLAPIVFGTIIVGIAKMGNPKEIEPAAIPARAAV